MRYARSVHSGERYRLGYEAGYPGYGYYQIWDQQNEQLVQRFTLTDDGWRQAWERFVALESEPSEVGRAGGRAGSGGRRRWSLLRRNAGS